MAKTHYSKLGGRRATGTSFPSSPFTGQEFYHTDHDVLYRYDGTNWLGVKFITTTSTSTSTTTTSTSTTTTSTSSSTTTSISTTTSLSTSSSTTL